MDTLENNYINYFEKFGIKLIPISNSTKNINSYFEKFPISGIILSGGNDINPELYNKKINESEKKKLFISNERDETEKELLRIAIKKKIPVLGICRGMQFINVFFKGKLINIKEENQSEIGHLATEHTIKIINNKAKKLLNNESRINSYHGYGINKKTLSSELEIFAQTDDALIEGLYHPLFPIVGIQWHPERKSPDERINNKLIEAFLKKELFWKIKNKKMKTIILAAGMGTRLGKYNSNLPKCLLEFNKKTLIERQIETLRACGLNDIIVVKGYMSKKLQMPNVKFYFNKDFANTNMVETLFCAEKEMDDELLVCYSDILYDKEIINKITSSHVDIGVVVDKDYWDYWNARMDEPEKDMESLVIDEQGKIIEMGDTTCSRDKAKVRYVGLIKFSKKGVQALKKVYQENKEKYFDKDEQWLKSKSFKKAYMTSMLQALINEGYRVDPIIISRGWMEFDTEEDYEKANLWLKDGSIKRFINIEK